jgi:hypothetical protein
MNPALQVVNVQFRQASGGRMNQALQVVNVQFGQAKRRKVCNPSADESCWNETSVALYTVSSSLASLSTNPSQGRYLSCRLSLKKKEKSFSSGSKSGFLETSWDVNSYCTA